MKKLLLTLTLLLSFATAFAGEPSTIKLNTANTVNFRGEVDESSTTKATLELIRLVRERGAKNYPIYLVLDSPGGSVYAGLGFIEFIQTLENVHTISLFAASMASAIVEANPGKRYVTKSGILMFHRAKGGFQGQFEEGEVEQQLRLWKAIVLQMENTNAKRMGMSLADYKAKVKDEYWLLGDEAVPGAADAVVTVKCSDELIDKRENIIQQGLFASVQTTFSGCPLLRGPVEQAAGE